MMSVKRLGDLPSVIKKQQADARHWTKRWWAQTLVLLLETAGFLLILYVVCLWLASGR